MMEGKRRYIGLLKMDNSYSSRLEQIYWLAWNLGPGIGIEANGLYARSQDLVDCGRTKYLLEKYRPVTWLGSFGWPTTLQISTCVYLTLVISFGSLFAPIKLLRLFLSGRVSDRPSSFVNQHRLRRSRITVSWGACVVHRVSRERHEDHKTIR